MKTNNMKNFIELKYRKNSKQEIVFENLDEIKEGDNVVLRLKDGDLTPIFYINAIDNLFIPYLPIDKEIAIELDGLFYEKYLQCKTLDNDFIFSTFQDSEEVKTCKNILPKWNIPEDSAVLFLSKEDCKKYYDLYKNIEEDIHFIYNNEFYSYVTTSRYTENVIKEMQKEGVELSKNISIILPQLHAEQTQTDCIYHIENVNKVCKELKEKYEVERIELPVSHCFVWEWLEYLKWQLNQDEDGGLNKEDYYNEKNIFIDKITTTNSTGILEVQKSDRLEVIDCLEFFDI